MTRSSSSKQPPNNRPKPGVLNQDRLNRCQVSLHPVSKVLQVCKQLRV